MEDAMKHDFMCQLSDMWRSIMCLSEIALVLKTLVENPCSFSILKDKQ